MARQWCNRSAGGLIMALVVFLAPLPWAPGQQDKGLRPAAAVLSVGNETGKSVSLAPGDWKKLPRRTLMVKDRNGTQVRYEGVSLTEVLRFAGVPFVKGHLRGPRAALYVLIEARDGYRTVFALAEVDPSMTDKVILLADRRDGKPLPESVGPYRLVVSGDKIHSRWVRQVKRITVGSPAESVKKSPR